jgi:hypothetical protein
MLGVRSQILCCYHGHFSTSCDVCCCPGVLLVMRCTFLAHGCFESPPYESAWGFHEQSRVGSVRHFFSLLHSSTARKETADAIPDSSISSANVLDTLNFWHMHGTRHMIWPQRWKLNPGCIPSTDPECTSLNSGDIISAFQVSESRTPTLPGGFS